MGLRAVARQTASAQLLTKGFGEVREGPIAISLTKAVPKVFGKVTTKRFCTTKEVL